MRGWRSMQQEYFVQTDWRWNPDITFNVGLRYSYFSPYSEVNNAISNLYANQVAAIGPDRPLYQPDRNNFQPRVGIAWDLGGRGNTVLRSGYSIYTDRIYQIQFTGNVSNIPFAVTSAAANVPFNLGAQAPVNPSTAAPAFTAVDPGLKNPLTHRFLAGIEQRLNEATTVNIAYIGARGRELIRATDPNGGVSVPLTARPDPRFARVVFVTNDASSDYNALQLLLRRRFSQGIDFTGAYTYGRSVDDSSTDLTFGSTPSLLNSAANANLAGVQGGGTAFVPRPREADRGRSNFDVRHSFALSHIVDMPFGRGRKFLSGASGIVNALAGGWSFGGILVMRTGEPFTVTLGSDVNDDGDAASDRPALTRGDISDLYAKGNRVRTQYLVPQTEALARLVVPDPITDPFKAIERNAFESPSVWYYDASLIKRFSVTESMNLSLEANVFNVFNHANFAAPVANLSSAFFGTVTGTRFGTNPRQVQLGLKLVF
jgi:hypothetical protein